MSPIMRQNRGLMVLRFWAKTARKPWLQYSSLPPSSDTANDIIAGLVGTFSRSNSATRFG